MNSTFLHIAFDVVAWVAAGLSLYWLRRRSGIQFQASPAGDLSYIAALVFGAGLGAVLFGTANLWLSHQAGIARSIEGAIAGGIIAVELYKRMTGISGRTGARFALPLAVGVAVGRIGCYFAGLDDFTYGTPTTLPWGHDFGDGVLAPSGAALRKRGDGGVRDRLCAARATRRSLRDRQRVLSRRRVLWRCSASSGSSSSPTRR